MLAWLWVVQRWALCRKEVEVEAGIELGIQVGESEIRLGAGGSYDSIGPIVN